MPDNRHHIERASGEEFEHFATRALETIGRLLMTDIEGLTADVDTLAQVIPELAQSITSLQATNAADEQALNDKIKELEAKEAEVAADAAALAVVKEELATAHGELAKVQTQKERLDPIVAQASSLVPAPAGQPGGAGAGEEPPLAPPAGETS